MNIEMSSCLKHSIVKIQKYKCVDFYIILNFWLSLTMQVIMMLSEKSFMSFSKWNKSSNFYLNFIPSHYLWINHYRFILSYFVVIHTWISLHAINKSEMFYLHLPSNNLLYPLHFPITHLRNFRDMSLENLIEILNGLFGRKKEMLKKECT